MSYHQFKDHDTEEGYGSFQTFWINGDLCEGTEFEAMETGWYWWPCFPGCIPESDPYGPFKREEDAVSDARQE